MKKNFTKFLAASVAASAVVVPVSTFAAEQTNEIVPGVYIGASEDRPAKFYTFDEIAELTPAELSDLFSDNEKVYVYIEGAGAANFTEIAENGNDFVKAVTANGSLGSENIENYIPSAEYETLSGDVIKIEVPGEPEELEVIDISAITVPDAFTFGVTEEEIIEALPSTVKGSLADGTEVELNVSWTAKDFLAERAGEFEFEATISSDDYVIPAEKQTQVVKVTVSEEVVGLIVESVSAINNNAVTVTFPEITEAIEDANVVVKDGEGNVVETKPLLLAEGTTQADFEFVTPFPVDHKFTGVWDVNGEKYNFDAINQLADIEEAVKANNEIELQAALDAAGITYADELRIAEYLLALDADALKSLDAVQKAITKVDEEEASATEKAAAVKAVVDAETQAQLLAALEANFDRVNSAWIVNYSVVGQGNLLAFAGTGAGNESIDFTTIQSAIDTTNLAQVAPKVEAANMSLDSAKVAEARTLVTNWIASEEGKVTIKDWALDGLDMEDALIAVNNAKTNSALKSALTNLDTVENKIVAKYKDVTSITGVAAPKLASAKLDVFKLDKVLDANLTAYREALAAKTDIDDKNQRSDIQQIITDVNESFGSLKAEESKVAASATAKPAFTIKALQKDGKVFATMADIQGDATVKIGDVTKNYEATSNFTAATAGELVLNAKSGQEFDLSTVGTETEATITFTTGTGADAVVHTVKALVKVTAGQIDATNTVATFDLSNVEGTYASGEEVEFTFTLKDAADNTIASENGTYASTITVGSDTYYQNITFVDGKATVTAPARTVVEDGNIQVVLTTKDNGALNITATSVITIEAGEFSKLSVAQQSTTSTIKITATDGVNTITDFGTKLVNIKAVKVVGETETPVTVAGTDYQGNVSKAFTTGVATHDTELTVGTYKVTVTVDGVTTTQTIVIPGA